MPIVTVTPADTRLLQDIADSIAHSKRTIVVTGAGISTNCGIPDFRSEHGLYNLVKSRYPHAVVKGRDMFDSILFSNPTSTKLFYSFLASLRNSVLTVKDTTPTHKFIRTLSETGRLLRCYTQNIDGLEEIEGMTTNLALGKGKRKRSTGDPTLDVIKDSEEEKGCQVVQLHGDLRSLRCMACQGLCKYDDEKVETLLGGDPPDCPECVGKDRKRRESGKRGTSVGSLRPNIVLYGEEHPLAEKIGILTTTDLRSSPDCMIILGTSLKVHGLRTIVKAFSQAVHSRKGMVVYINNTSVAHSAWKDVIDYHIEMDCDRWVMDVRTKRPGIWEMQSLLTLGKVKKATGCPKGKNKEEKESIATRPKAKAIGARKPLVSGTGNEVAPKKGKQIAVAVMPPTPPSTSGSRAEKKTPAACTRAPYSNNPPSLPDTPTKVRKRRSTALPPVSPTPPGSPLLSSWASASFSIEIGLASREKKPSFMDLATAGGSPSPPETPPPAKRRMLEHVPVARWSGVQAEIEGKVSLIDWGNMPKMASGEQPEMPGLGTKKTPIRINPAAPRRSVRERRKPPAFIGAP